MQNVKLEMNLLISPVFQENIYFFNVMSGSSLSTQVWGCQVKYF